MFVRILFLKSHVSGYTKRDGTYVKPHERKGVENTAISPGQFGLFDPRPPKPDPQSQTPMSLADGWASMRESDRLLAIESVDRTARSLHGNVRAAAKRMVASAWNDLPEDVRSKLEQDVRIHIRMKERSRMKRGL